LHSSASQANVELRDILNFVLFERAVVTCSATTTWAMDSDQRVASGCPERSEVRTAGGERGELLVGFLGQLEAFGASSTPISAVTSADEFGAPVADLARLIHPGAISTGTIAALTGGHLYPPRRESTGEIAKPCTGQRSNGETAAYTGVLAKTQRRLSSLSA
jgi:hypothetical protein